MLGQSVETIDKFRRKYTIGDTLGKIVKKKVRGNVIKKRSLREAAKRVGFFQ